MDSVTLDPNAVGAAAEGAQVLGSRALPSGPQGAPSVGPRSLMPRPPGPTTKTAGQLLAARPDLPHPDSPEAQDYQGAMQDLYKERGGKLLRPEHFKHRYDAMYSKQQSEKALQALQMAKKATHSLLADYMHSLQAADTEEARLDNDQAIVEQWLNEAKRTGVSNQFYQFNEAGVGAPTARHRELMLHFEKRAAEAARLGRRRDESRAALQRHLKEQGIPFPEGRHLSREALIRMLAGEAANAEHANEAATESEYDREFADLLGRGIEANYPSETIDRAAR